MTRLRSTLRPARLVALGALAALAPLLLASCDPCTGVASCRTPARAEITGQIVEYRTARGVKGTQISMRLSDGALATAVTDGDGRFRLVAPASGVDSVTADITMRGPDPYATFTVSRMRFKTVTRVGDAVEVGRWMRNPGRRIVARVLSRLTGQALSGAEVSYVRTGGAVLSSDSIAVRADDNGTFILDFDGDRLSDVVGRFRVSHPDLPAPTVYEGLPFALSLTEIPPNVNFEWLLGPMLSYVGQVVDGESGQPIVGASVSYSYLSGVSVGSAVTTVTSGPGGLFAFNIPTRAYGTVNGTLSILAAGAPGSSTTSRPLTLTTFDSLYARWLGPFPYGKLTARVNSVVEVWAFSTMVPTSGIPVVFRRTGGLATTTPVVSMVSASNGRVTISPTVSDTGTMIGDLVLDAGSPDSTVYPNVQLRADFDPGLKFYGVLGFGPSLRYMGEVLKIGSAAPVPDATVRFVRTGGIRLARDTVISTTNSVGWFAFGVVPLEAGSVVGDLYITPPPPWAGGYLFSKDVRMSTYVGSDTKLLGTWRVPVP